jgi:hypothetical protein
VTIIQKIKLNFWCIVAGVLLLGSCFPTGGFSVDVSPAAEMSSAETLDFVLEAHSGDDSDQHAAWRCDYESVWHCAVRNSRGGNLRCNAMAADHEKVVAVHIDCAATHQLRVLELQFCETEYINLCKLRRVLPLRAGPVSV